MATPNDHNGGTTGTGGESPQEPLIDRQLELDLLRQHIARVADTGKGHAVLILGESGVGKSRLAVEVTSEACQRGMTVISVRCLGRGAEPLLPLKEALASYLGRTPDQIRRTLARAAPHLLDAVPFIVAFLASIGEKLAEGSFSLRGVYEEQPPPRATMHKETMHKELSAGMARPGGFTEDRNAWSMSRHDAACSMPGRQPRGSRQ